MPQFDELPLDTQASSSGFDEQPYEPPAAPPARAATKLTDVAAAPFQRAGSEITGGARELVGADTSSGDALTNLLQSILRMGGAPTSEGFREGVSRVISPILGAGRILGSGASALGALAGKGARYAGEALGAPESVLGPAETGADILGTLLAPSAVANAPLRLLRAGVTAPIRPVIKGMQELTASEKAAEEVAASNRAINRATNAPRAAAIQEAEQQAAQAHAELARATAELDNTTNTLVRRQGGVLTSPFGASLSAPVTNREAYSFIEALKPGSTPSIPLTKTQETAQKIIDEFAGTPTSLAPAKGIKTAGALAGETAAPTIGGSELPLENLTDLQKKAYEPLLEMLKAQNKVGGIAPDKLTAFKNSLGEFSQTTGGSIIGRRLYRSLMEDLRGAAQSNPAAAQYLRASDVASQNLAAADIADKITYNGTSINPTTGKLVLQPGAIEKAVSKDELLAGLPEAKKQEFIDTINNVFRVRTRVAQAQAGIKEAERGVKAAQKLPESRLPELPEIVTPPKVKAGIFSRNIAGAAGATLGGTAGTATGLPHLGFGGVIAGFHGGAATADRAYQMIFQIAMRPGGRQFLQTLYGDLPPIAGDTAKLAALQSFLQSSGRPQ